MTTLSATGADMDAPRAHIAGAGGGRVMPGSEPADVLGYWQSAWTAASIALGTALRSRTLSASEVGKRRASLLIEQEVVGRVLRALDAALSAVARERLVTEAVAPWTRPRTPAPTVEAGQRLQVRGRPWVDGIHSALVEATKPAERENRKEEAA